jgi:hypothetical protein
MKIGRLFLGMLGSALAATGANAADPTPAPTVVATPPPAASTAGQAFDWSGLYFGVFHGAFFGPSFNFNGWDTGLQIGHNWVRNNLLFGVEAAAGLFYVLNPFDRSSLYGELDARVGALVGDRAIAYAELGVARYLTPSSPVWLPVGGGIGFAVSDTLSIFGEAKVHLAPGFGVYGYTIHVGVNLHR